MHETPKQTPQQEVQRQNRRTVTTQENDSSVDLHPSKLIYFYSDHPFTTMEERNLYKTGRIDKTKHKQKFLDSVAYYFKINTENVQYIKEQLQNTPPHDEEGLRKNLKILIIIGSQIKYKSKKSSDQESAEDEYYISGFEDMNTALLLCHLFHYACNIEYDNILLTSSNQHNFIKTKNPNAKISAHNSPSKTPVKDKSSKSQDQAQSIPNILYKNKISTLINDTVAFAQVGTKQIQFIPDIDVESKIKPFNRYFLKTLHTDENSELLVFFLDHGVAGFFHRLDYQYFVERLMEITTKHITIFNQSCFSGSLIELIEISEIINEVIDLSKDSNQQCFQQLQSIANDDSLSIDQQIQYIQRNYHISPETTKEKIIYMLELLTHYKQPFSISPQLFIQLKQKSTIFCSCSSTSECPTLPFREIIGPKTTTANSQGGVFSSAFINSLFFPNQENDFSFSKFINNLQNELAKMEGELKDILIKQNTIDAPSDIYDDTTKAQCDNLQALMKQYFKSELGKPAYSISSRDKIPNIRSILVSDEFWNIEVCDVDPLEYNIKVFDYNLYEESSDDDQNINEDETEDVNISGYGPRKGTHNEGKFMIDFRDCFNSILIKREIEQKFDVFLTVDSYSEETLKKYSSFYGRALKILDYYTIIPYVYLGESIKANYQCNFNNFSDYFDICLQALKTIIEYWKDFKFYHLMF